MVIYLLYFKQVDVLGWEWLIFVLFLMFPFFAVADHYFYYKEIEGDKFIFSGFFIEKLVPLKDIETVVYYRTIKRGRNIQIVFWDAGVRREKTWSVSNYELGTIIRLNRLLAEQNPSIEFIFDDNLQNLLPQGTEDTKFPPLESVGDWIELIVKLVFWAGLIFFMLKTATEIDSIFLGKT
jgi:hypothetical protein